MTPKAQTKPLPIPISKPLIGKEEQEAVQDVLASGQIASGPKVKAFEQAFANYVGAKHAIAVCNGTAALHAALAGLGLPPGSEVILPDFSFIASANSILLAGHRPVFADIDPQTYTLDPGALKKAVTKKTRAIMPVHLYGQPADMDPIREFARQHDLAVVADCAQSHGATYGGKMVGTLGDVGCFSFYATKNMTTGEGGMVTTSLDGLAETVRSFVNQGRAAGAQFGTYDHVRIGHNFRMTDVAAAMGLVQLDKLEDWNARRKAVAGRYTKSFRDLPNITVPEVRMGSTHAWHQYTVRVPDRARFVETMKAQDVGVGVYYPKTMHEYAHLAAMPRGTTKHAEKAAKGVVSLPVHPSVSDADAERVVLAVQGALAPS